MPASRLAELLQCPTAYLSQLLVHLQEPGILGSRRGASGGVYIARPLREITLLEIVITLEGDAFFNNCFLGIDGCGHIEPCPFHNTWARYRNNIQDWMSRTTLHDLCHDVTEQWMLARMKFNHPSAESASEKK